MTRDQERSLWVHRSLLTGLMSDPDGTLTTARQNLERLASIHSRGATATWLQAWREVLDSGVDRLADTLVARTETAIEPRQNTSFAGVLAQDTRTAVLATFREHLAREHVHVAATV